MRQLLAVAVLATLFAPPVQAAPITVSAGDFITFNFDLSGETPAPPYVIAGVDLRRSGLDFEPPPCGICSPLDIGEWKFWTELDGQGSVFLTHDATLGGAWNFAEMLDDGVFSATLEMFEGEIVVDPVACGVAADGARTPGCPAGPLPPAPEPAAVTLLAIGAAAAIAGRRKARRG
jgi:hypothetical protein